MDNKAVVSFLLSECNADPNCTAGNGYTPMSLAESSEVVKLLLQHGGVTNNLPKCLLAAKCFNKVPQSNVSVFMVGDEGAGKSTLLKALKREGRRGWRIRKPKVTGVKEKTAGIEYHSLDNSLYDMGGNRDFHGARDTVIRSSITSAMFLLVVNLCASLLDLKQTVLYWISFIQSKIRVELGSPVVIPYLLAAGSHSDAVRSKPQLEEKESVVRSLCGDAENINFVDYVGVDCRYNESPAITHLRQQISSTRHQIRQRAPEITFLSHTLYVYLVSECGSKPGLQLGSLVKTFEADPLSWKERFLPQTLEELHEACSILNKRGVILYVQTQTIESSWIITDIMLLREVNRSVFAPAGFTEHKSLTQTGVVPFSKICSTFADLISAKKTNPELIVDFLADMEFCREIREEDLPKLVTQAHSEYASERHFLFPALTQQTPPPDLWQPHSDQYTCCWVLRCLEHHYLSPRFQQVLLLRLAFEHSEAVERPTKEAATSPVLHQQCSLWKNGIKWKTDSSNVLVEISDHRVVLFLSCRSDVDKKSKELELLSTRSQVIGQILKAKAEFCGSVQTVEEFIPDPQYPVNIRCTSISIEKVAQAICNGKEVVDTSTDVPPVSKLLHFEPFCFCSLQCLVDLYCKEHAFCKVTSSFFEGLSSTITSIDDFCTVLDVSLHTISVDSDSSDYHKAQRVFQEWQTGSEGTYHCLRQQMEKYSIFYGRNILVYMSTPFISVTCNVIMVFSLFTGSS